MSVKCAGGALCGCPNHLGPWLAEKSELMALKLEKDLLKDCIRGLMRTPRELANDWELPQDDNYEYWVHQAENMLSL